MKRNTNNTNITAVSRKFGWLPLVAFAAMLAGCTADDTLPADGSSDTPVAFTAGIESAALPGTKSPTPDTRTVIGADGKTGWTQGDAVGIFMLSAGGAMPADILLDADNVKHNVAPTTGALSPDGTPIYYPQTAKVDFIALYPYSNKGTENGKITADYKYTVSVVDQTNPATIDVLYAKATGQERSKTPVDLSFGHVLSKIKLDINFGQGMTGLIADQITALTLSGMPASATLALQDGTLTPGALGNISALKEASPSADATATFTALVPPQAANSYTRSIIVTVDGVEYSGNIPVTYAYASNAMYTYPVTVQKSGIIVGTPEIAKWETNEYAGTTEFVYTVTFDANGGGNAPAPQEALAGKSTSLPGREELTPPAANKVFAGWSTTADYSGDFYRAGYEFAPQSNTTLYAVWSGDGLSEANPIFIFDVEGLRAIPYRSARRHYCLMEDITVSGWNGPEEFSGTFNGLGHTVTINKSDDYGESRSGLFRSGSGCRIRQVCVAGNIENVGDFISGGGGIIGKTENGCVIENCLVTANIRLNSQYLGGIVGEGKDVIVRNCLVRGYIDDVRSDDIAYVGGIIGRGSNSGQIVNCVVLSERLSNSAKRQDVSPIYRIGDGKVRNNYGYKDMVGEYRDNNNKKAWSNDMDGSDGADCDPKPTQGWWTNAGNWNTADSNTAWDFTNIWEMDPDDYPRLRIVHP